MGETNGVTTFNARSATEHGLVEPQQKKNRLVPSYSFRAFGRSRSLPLPRSSLFGTPALSAVSLWARYGDSRPLLRRQHPRLRTSSLLSLYLSMDFRFLLSLVRILIGGSRLGFYLRDCLRKHQAFLSPGICPIVLSLSSDICPFWLVIYLSFPCAVVGTTSGADHWLFVVSDPYASLGYVVLYRRSAFLHVNTVISDSSSLSI